MKRTSALIGSCIGLAFALLPANAHAQDKKDLKNLEDVLTFKVRVQPHDPFDARNETKAIEKWQASLHTRVVLGLPLPEHELGANGIWKVRRGEVARIEISGTLKDGWNTYPITQRTAEQPVSMLTSWTLEPEKGATPLWPIYESTPKTTTEPGAGTLLKLVKEFTWSQDVLVAMNAPSKLVVPVKLNIQVCSGNCIWFKHTIPVTLEVSEAEALPINGDIEARLKLTKPSISVIGDIAKTVEPVGKTEGLIRDSHEQYKAKMEEIAKKIGKLDNAAAQQGDDGLLAFVLAGIFWGAISLITPCVFPMIPITVSFFLKQSEKDHHRPIVMASVYSATIIVVLTLAAAFLLSVFREMSIHPVTNYIIGGLFVFFALSLFGMYEIELPHSLAQFTSAREGQGGIVGTIFMALTFTIISFACVAPFLGGFGGTAAGNRPLWHNLLGGLAFSVTFASPFFFLALFPALLKKLPKSGSWLNSVKVVMGFLEFAAAFKFFRTAELIQTNGRSGFFTFDLILGLWIGMCVLCALYLLGVFRLPHDTPEEHVSVPRLLFSMAFLGLALYLTPALFKVNNDGESQRPNGAVYSWVDSFLLPDSRDEGSSTANMEYAIAQTRLEGKPKRIFVDFTGVTCTNCKINENTVFKRPNISKLLGQYVMVKLYTDTVPLEYYASDAIANNADRPKRDAKEVNLPWQRAVSKSEANPNGTEQLPLYVILEPMADGSIKVVAIYPEGRINDEAAFAEFLRKPEGN